MANISDNISFIKKNKISFIAIFAFAVALCCIFAFAGNNSSEGSISAGNIPAAAGNLPIVEATAINGYGIYADGHFVAAAPSLESAQAAIDYSLNAHVSELRINENAISSFANSIEIVEGTYSSACFVDNISALLSSDVTNYCGELLPVTLSVKSVSTYSANVIIEHETKTIYTDALSDGKTDVISEGFDGEGVETYEIVSVDGEEISRTAVSIDVTTEAVSEIIRVGTRTDGIHTASIANFVKPYDGIISSYMGPRWGTIHNGLDICQNGGCFKDPAYAACGGVVINAKDSGNGYGKCVIIDHGNGITTLYAHLNSFSVEVGDIVEAGDEIGLIGSTGYSLGPHLHFEVRIDDVPVNPLYFVDYSDVIDE